MGFVGTAAAAIEFDAYEQLDGATWFTSSAIGDVTGDGREDLLAWREAEGAGELRVYKQTAAGSLAEPEIHPTTFDYAYYSGIGIGDIDGDELNDVAVAGFDSVDLFFQSEAGGLEGPQPVTATNAPERSSPWPSNARSVQIADFTGDGLGDLAVGTYDYGVQFLRNTGTGFQATSVTPEEWEMQEIELGDLNDDGDLDFAWGPFPQIEVALGTGTGSFSAGGAFNHSVEEGMEVTDVTGDQRDDAILSSWDGLHVFAQGSQGLASQPTQHCNHRGLSLQPVEAADVTGDGAQDAITADSNHVYVYPGFSGGGLSDASTIADPPNQSHRDPSSLSLGDLNGDSRIDIALATNGGLLVIRQSSDSTPAAPTHPCDTTPPTVTISDEPLTMNDDGTVDVEVGCEEDEVSGPCLVNLRLRTEEQVTFQGRVWNWSLDDGGASIPAGDTRLITVGGRWDDRALLVQQQQLRMVASATAGDQQDNGSTAEAVVEVSAPPGTEPLRCAGVVANHIGTERDDFLSGGYVDDVFVVGAGQDSIRGDEGNDIICGGAGDDYIFGQDGNDEGWGGSGTDLLRGHGGDDDLHGGADPDVLNGGAGFDRCIGGAPAPDKGAFGDSATRTCERVRGAR